MQKFQRRLFALSLVFVLFAAPAQAAELEGGEELTSIEAVCFEEPCGSDGFSLPEGNQVISLNGEVARDIIESVTADENDCLGRTCDEAVAQRTELVPREWPLSFEDRLNREATSLALAHQLFNVADTIQTADCRTRGICREVNPAMKLPIPLFVAAKAAVGVGSWIMFNNIRDDDPERAREFAYRAALVSGGTVMFNTRISNR